MKQKGHWRVGQNFWSRTQFPQASVWWEIYWMTSKDPSSSDHHRVWEPEPSASFRKQYSLIQVVVTAGQRRGQKLGMKSARWEKFGGPRALVPCWNVRGFLLEQVTVLPAMPSAFCSSKVSSLTWRFPRKSHRLWVMHI